MEVPPEATLYLFSDGVFEFVTPDGIEWGLGDFIPYLSQPVIAYLPECQRLYREVRRFYYAPHAGWTMTFRRWFLKFSTDARLTERKIKED